MSARTRVLGVEEERALAAVSAATPSLVGDLPCRLVFRSERVDVWSVPAAAREPSRSEVISCGAAVFDLTVAVRAFGRMTAVHVRPLRSEPRLIAAVHIGREREPRRQDRAFYEAMTQPERHETPDIDLNGFWSDVMGGLGAAALDGRGGLAWLTTPQRLAVSEVLAEAGRGVGVGVETPSMLDVTTYAATHAHARMAVLSTRGDDPVLWVWAGVAWRRVLLTAASLGLSTSCVGALLDSGDTRQRIQNALGDLAWPQVVLRFGLEADRATTCTPACVGGTEAIDLGE